jgi:hypothetical protein
MLELEPTTAPNIGDETTATATLHGSRTAVHAKLIGPHTKLIGLVTTWAKGKERYADLRSRARSPSAHELVTRMSTAAEVEFANVAREAEAGSLRPLSASWATYCVLGLAMSPAAASFAPQGRAASRMIP